MGCEDLLGVTISQPSALIVTPNVTAGTCGLPNGSANVTPSGGTPPYSYLWSPGGGTASTLQGLPAGNYTNTTTDAHGCTVVNSMTVTNSGSLTAAVSSSEQCFV
ncbi:MAG: SprB repeat-containing protein [Bacteroidetes bacterium]|nr:SprB repeat-containing protein [Bacteroidota bacterium]